MAMVSTTPYYRPNVFHFGLHWSRETSKSIARRQPFLARSLSHSSRNPAGQFASLRYPLGLGPCNSVLEPSQAAKLLGTRRKYTTMNVSSLIPPHSWDSHMHVVDPSTYPLARTATYTPAPHTLTSALTYYSALSTPPLNVVLVQPSIYGNDNSCLLDALRTLGPARARGVVTFDPLTTDFGPLQDAHRLGVRGVRVNLYSVGKEMDETGLRAELQAYADVIKEIGWVLQLYVPLKMVPLLERIVPELGVTVCLDHFGQPALPLPGSKERYATSKDPYDLEGFGSLIRLLRQGSTYVKMSAPYRISKQDDMSDLEPLAKEILNVAGRSRVVFATDWPHTRFEGVDIRPFIERVLDWCGQDEELVERVFKGNAEDLWGVGR